MVAKSEFISKIKVGDKVFSTLIDSPFEVINTTYGIEVDCPPDLPVGLATTAVVDK